MTDLLRLNQNLDKRLQALKQNSRRIVQFSERLRSKPRPEAREMASRLSRLKTLLRRLDESF